jgi:chemotaxis protein histidine kinase CheA
MDEFRSEVNDHLRRLESQLLALERDPANAQPVRQMFLSAHTIKGDAAMVGRDDVRVLAHAMEDVLAELRDRRGVMDASMADMLLRTVDALRALVEAPDPDALSEVQRGSSLVAELRSKVQPPPIVETDKAEAAEASSSSALDPTVLRALLVEGSATVRMLEEMLLADAGFQVEALEDGRAAVERVADGAYDLLVTGAQTRTLAGLDLVEEIRQTPNGRDLPVIVMSSDAHPEDHVRALELGVGHYITRGSLTHQLLAEVAGRIAAKSRRV